MKENFLHFLSCTPAIIEINGKHIGSIDNVNCMELDVITHTKNIYVTYSPISEKFNALPYTAIINTDNTPTTKNINLTIIPFPNNHYDILFSPFFYYPEKKANVLFNKPLGQYFISVVSDTQTKIIIYSGVTIVFSILIPLITAVKVMEKNSVIIIQGLIDEMTYYLLAVESKNFNILYNDTTQSIEESGNVILAYKNLNTLCHHGKVYNINTENKKIEDFCVFESDQPYTNFHNIIIPNAFLECIKIGDEKTAKSFLADNLQNTNIQQYKDYFGDIDDIYLNRHETSDYKCNYTIKSNKWRNYNFLIDNNKIYDIEEIF